MDFYETSACSNLNIKEVRGDKAEGGEKKEGGSRGVPPLTFLAPPRGSPRSFPAVLHAADGAGAAGAPQGAGGAARRRRPPRPGPAGGGRAAAPGGAGQPQELLVLKPVRSSTPPYTHNPPSSPPPPPDPFWGGGGGELGVHGGGVPGAVCTPRAPLPPPGFAHSVSTIKEMLEPPHTSPAGSSGATGTASPRQCHRGVLGTSQGTATRAAMNNGGAGLVSPFLAWGHGRGARRDIEQRALGWQWAPGWVGTGMPFLTGTGGHQRVPAYWWALGQGQLAPAGWGRGGVEAAVPPRAHPAPRYLPAPQLCGAPFPQRGQRPCPTPRRCELLRLLGASPRPSSASSSSPWAGASGWDGSGFCQVTAGRGDFGGITWEPGGPIKAGGQRAGRQQSPSAPAAMSVPVAKSFYDLSATSLQGEKVDFNVFRGRVVLIENVASL